MSRPDVPSFLTKIACGREMDNDVSSGDSVENHESTGAEMEKVRLGEVDKETGTSDNVAYDGCKLSPHEGSADNSLSPR